MRTQPCGSSCQGFKFTCLDRFRPVWLPCVLRRVSAKHDIVSCFLVIRALFCSMLENASLSEISLVCPDLAMRRAIERRISAYVYHKHWAGEYGRGYRVDYYERDLVRLRWYINRLDYYYLSQLQCASEDVTLTDIRRDWRHEKDEETAIRDVFRGWYLPRRRAKSEPFIEHYLQMMKDTSKQARIQERRFLLELELLEKLSRGWYIVFNTLTIDPENYNAVFSTGSKHWNNYIRAIDRLLYIGRFGSVREGASQVRRKTDMHTYCAVVEAGELNGRLHIHVVHAFSHLPYGAADPNIGAAIAHRRELQCLKSAWRYGHSTPIAVRVDGTDPYSDLGWVWPLKWDDATSSYQPYDAKPIGAVAAYLSKYLMKTLGNERLKGQWRTKTSQRYGTTLIDVAVRAMKTTTIANFVLGIKKTTMLPTLGERVIPTRILRIAATRELMNRLMDWEQSKVWKTLITLQPQKDIVKSLQESMQTLRMKTTVQSNHQSSMNASMRISNDMDISDAQDCFELAFQEIEDLQRIRGYTSRSHRQGHA